MYNVDYSINTCNSFFSLNIQTFYVLQAFCSSDKITLKALNKHIYIILKDDYLWTINVWQIKCSFPVKKGGKKKKKKKLHNRFSANLWLLQNI